MASASSSSSRPGAALAEAVASRDADGIRKLMSQWGTMLRRDDAAPQDGGDEAMSGFLNDFLQAGGVKLLLKELDESCAVAEDQQAQQTEQQRQKRIAELEALKKKAVKNEDFGLAGKIKMELEELRGPSEPSSPAKKDRSSSPTSRSKSSKAAKEDGKSGQSSAATTPTPKVAAAVPPPKAASPAAPKAPVEDAFQKGARTLMGMLQKDKRLDKWFQECDLTQARSQLCEFLQIPVDGPVSPTFQLSSSLLAFHIEELVDALLDELAALGSDERDMLVTAIVSLGKEPPSRDERIARFFSRVCDAHVAVNAKNRSADDGSKYVVKALNGYWLDSEGMVCTVEDGKCAIGHSSKVSIAVKKDQIVMNGWVASALSSKAVEWQKGEKSLTWNRITQGESEKLEAEHQALERKKKDEAAEKKRVQEEEKKRKAEAERKAKEEEAERKRKETEAKKEAERQAKEEAAQRKRMEEEEKKAKKEADRKAKEEAERKAKDEAAQRKQKEEEEKKAKKEADRRAKEEAAERKRQDEEEKRIKKDEEKKAKAEAERRRLEEAKYRWKAPATAEFDPSLNSSAGDADDGSGSQDALATAVSIILDTLQAEVRLGAVLLCSKAEDLDAATREFLGTVFDGAAWPSEFRLCRQALPKPLLSDVSAMVVEGMGSQIPLGEDVVTFAIASLGKDPLMQDSRVKAFASHLQAVAKDQHVAQQFLKTLGGLWQSRDGQIYTIAEGGKCTVSSGGAFQVTVPHVLPSFGGWTAVDATDTVVRWRKDDKIVEWVRVEKISQVEVLSGLWKNTQGSVCTVTGGRCRFMSRTVDMPLVLQNGMLALGAWVAVGITAKVVNWQKADQCMEWHRIEHARDLDMLNTTWKNTDGLVCTVADGLCTFASNTSQSFPIVVADGTITLNGWKVLTLAAESIQWQKADRKMEWKRLQQPDKAAEQKTATTKAEAKPPDKPAEQKVAVTSAETKRPDKTAEQKVTGGSPDKAGPTAGVITGTKVVAEKTIESAAPPNTLDVKSSDKINDKVGGKVDDTLTAEGGRASPGAAVLSEIQMPDRWKDPGHVRNGSGNVSVEDVISEPDSEPVSKDEDAGTHGKSSLNRASMSLLDSLRSDTRLMRMTQSSDVQHLEGHLRKLLLRSLDGSEWPACHPKRSLLKACFGEFVDFLADILQRRRTVSLGEDVLASTVESLESEPLMSDERLLRFHEQIRNLVGTVDKALKEKEVQCLQSLNGLWKNTDGLTCTVQDGKCDFMSRAIIQIVQSGGKLILNGWEAAAITDTSVKWQKADKTMQWDRIEHAADLDSLNGTWMNDDGITCKVVKGMCTFNSKDTFPIAVKEGAIMLNGWTAIAITDKVIRWQKLERVMAWKRAADQQPAPSTQKPSPSPTPPPNRDGVPEKTVSKPVEALTGVWTSTNDDLMRTVYQGICTDTKGEAVKVQLKTGVATIKGWAAFVKDFSTVRWDRDGQTFEWHRVQDVAKVDSLKGAWKNSDGLACEVVDGICTFTAKGVRVPLKMQDGLINLNGWVAITITSKVVTWQKMGHSMEWHRVDQNPSVAKDNPKAQASKSSPKVQTAETSPKAQIAPTSPKVQSAPGSPKAQTTTTTTTDKAVTNASSASPMKQLNGIWSSSDGSTCTALEGECVIGETRFDITLVEGTLVLNGWKAVDIAAARVKWQKQDQTMEWRRIQKITDVDMLKGFWKNTDGLVCFVHNEACSFVSRGITSRLLMVEGVLTLNGWMVSGLTSRVVSWKKGQQVMLWHRVENAKELEVFNGVWKASDGSICNVFEGVCVYSVKGRASVALALENGLVMLQGWAATSITPTLIQWHSSGKNMEWRRDDNEVSPDKVAAPSKPAKGDSASPTPSSVPAAESNSAPQESIGLIGVWQTTDGLTCTVAGGTCTFVKQGACAIALSDGQHVLNGWKATEITADNVKWEKFGRSMQWNRVQAAKDIVEIAGTWKNTDGLTCDVADGLCTFAGRPSIELIMQSGLVTLNGWSAIAIRSTSVTWQKLGRTMEWERLQ